MRCAKRRRGCVNREGKARTQVPRRRAGPGAQPGAKLCGLHVAERDGKRVGGVGGLGRFAHAQQRAHHQLHLLLVRVPVAGHGSFYFARRIAAHGDASLRRGQQNHAANFGQPQRRFHIERGEYRFDRDAVRLEFLDQCGSAWREFRGAVRENVRGLCAWRAARRNAACGSGGRRFQSRRSRWPRPRRDRRRARGSNSPFVRERIAARA